jgi:hypothetical protein
MELLTIDLTGFDWLLYTLAIAVPIWLRHGKRLEKPVTLEDVGQDYSFAKGLESYGIKFQISPAIAQPKVNSTLSADIESSWNRVIETVQRNRPIMPMAIAPESSITIRTQPNDQTPTDDLEVLTVTQLKALCKLQGYTRYSKMNKHELILTLRGLNRE